MPGPAENSNDAHLTVNVQFSSTGKCCYMRTDDRTRATESRISWVLGRSWFPGYDYSMCKCNIDGGEEVLIG